jgi:hypothetical protein
MYTTVSAKMHKIFSDAAINWLFLGHSIILIQWETYNVKNTYITLDTSERKYKETIFYTLCTTWKIVKQNHRQQHGHQIPHPKKLQRVHLYKNSHSSAVGALTLRREPNSREMPVSLCIKTVKSFIVQSSKQFVPPKMFELGPDPCNWPLVPWNRNLQVSSQVTITYSENLHSQ